MADVGSLSDERHTEVMASLGRIEAALGRAARPAQPEPTPDKCLSGVYTADSDGDGSAETQFGSWRHREVEKVLTFTPTDSWSNSWWVGQFGGDYPYLDRLIITIGLCLKGQNVDSAVTGTPWKDWATAVKKAGIIKPVFRLGHEANGNWYDWKITGHESTWYKRYQLAADQCKQAFPESTIQMCLAAGQRTTGFTYPDKQSSSPTASTSTTRATARVPGPTTSRSPRTTASPCPSPSGACGPSPTAGVTTRPSSTRWRTTSRGTARAAPSATSTRTRHPSTSCPPTRTASSATSSASAARSRRA